MLGANVPTIGGFHTGFKWANEWGCECIQIYITLSRTWRVKDLSKGEIIKFKNAWQESRVKEVVAHIPYLVNLASPNREIREKSINRLVAEISRANQLGVKFLVLHPGSSGKSIKKEGIQRIVEVLNYILQKVDCSSVKILLETMAGQGTMIGSNFQELSEILEKISRSESFGVCLDTSHLFMAGYDIRGYEGWKRILEEFDKIIGVEKIQAIHLNDSKTKLASRSDRHACIGEGKLGLQVFQAILRDERFRNIPKILEIPERDTRSKDNLELLRNLEKTSGPLPEESKDPTQLTLKEVI